MMVVLLSVGLASFFFGIGLVMECIVEQKAIVVYTFLLLGIVFLTTHSYLNLSEKIWPKGEKQGWASGVMQFKGQTYEKSLIKPRVIDKLIVRQGTSGQFNYPKEWLVTFKEFGNNRPIDIKGEDYIEVQLKNPLKIDFISISIIEPRTDKDVPRAKEWAFEYILLREIRYFKHICRKDVYLSD